LYNLDFPEPCPVCGHYAYPNAFRCPEHQRREFAERQRREWLEAQHADRIDELLWELEELSQGDSDPFDLDPDRRDHIQTELAALGHES
jgi:hypothetical protein